MAGVFFAAAAVCLWAQFRVVPERVRFEVQSVFPRETSPGKCEQVDQRTLTSLADQGWELVSTMPYVYRNEERGPEFQGPKPVVTQTYPAYFFKRVKVTPSGREYSQNNAATPCGMGLWPVIFPAKTQAEGLNAS
jgi:hypothetical protein